MSIFRWLMHLFDPPPLVSMTQRQKVGRVFPFTASLLTMCILGAMLVAAGICLAQRTHALIRTVLTNDFSQAGKMAEIIILSIGVNAICVFILFQVRRLDRHLMNGPGSGS